MAVIHSAKLMQGKQPCGDLNKISAVMASVHGGWCPLMHKCVGVVALRADRIGSFPWGRRLVVFPEGGRKWEGRGILNQIKIPEKSNKS